jgi:hypothetical protein
MAWIVHRYGTGRSVGLFWPVGGLFGGRANGELGMKYSRLSLAAVGALALFASAPAFAGPTLTFSESAGVQPSNVATITVTQDGTDAVTIDLKFINSSYGILNSGHHLPLAFDLNSTGLAGTLSIPTATFTHPTGGTYADGTFTLSSGGTQSGLGTFNVGLSNSAGNGSGKAYYGELEFTLDSTMALDTSDFIKNSDGYYFTADLTNGSKTGPQGWGCDISDCRTTPPPPVPEPLTLSLFGAGLAGAVAMRRRKKA